MSRDARLYLIDMRDACARIMHHCGGLSGEQFFANELARDAVLWNLLVLGEAAKQVPEHIRLENSAIEWRKISGFRDVLAHGYFGLDEDIVWDVIENKIPPLLEAVEQTLTSLG
ncbi:MAG: DUF86 domain-containing protein [Sedimenticolaceae bacterium]